MSVVVEGDKGRLYLSPSAEQECLADIAAPEWIPNQEISYDPHSGATYCVLYGLTKFSDLFTDRQLTALTTFSDIAQTVRERVQSDAYSANLRVDGIALSLGGTDVIAYADAIALYLGFAISKTTDYCCSLCDWHRSGEKIGHLFNRQAIPMKWDFCEVNPLSDSSGNIRGMVEWVARAVEVLPANSIGCANQSDAQSQSVSIDKVVSTDPPYYDNVPYADLSDFFYVWLRHTLRSSFPDLFATLAAPKAEELVATPNRHGSTKKAEAFFLNGMTSAMNRLSQQAHPAFPVTIYYAFKQTNNNDKASTGWETFLDAVIRAGFSTSGTWPVRTELTNRMRGMGSNALASSIVLVCRPREFAATTATRREFLSALKIELPAALTHLQRANIAPVDLAQASIGPGMAIYTRYVEVLDAEGQRLSVREALSMINQTLDEVLSEQEGDFDSDTRWAVTWLDEYGFAEGDFGKADVLARAKVTAVSGLVDSGIVLSKAGKVRLLKPAELNDDWDPAKDKRITIWEIVHHLIRALETGGETAAGDLISKIGIQAEVARELAYRLYTICERKKRAGEALSYNALVQSWPEINRLAQSQPAPPAAAQAELFQGA